MPAPNDLYDIRDVLPADYNFILATWLRGLYYSDMWFKEMEKATFMKNYHKVIEAILARPGCSTKIACLKDDLNVILGYAVYKDTVVDWIFVKSSWRNIGIAKSLVPAGVTAVTHLTPVGLSILRKQPGVVFDPFLL